MGGLRTLIIDDSSVMRKIVERSLRQSGVCIERVLEAGNGAEGLELLRSQNVDLVLCDINMPVMDGLEFVRQFNQTGSHAPVLMVTTEGSQSQVVKAISYGAKGFIKKPFTPDQFRDHVKALLGF